MDKRSWRFTPANGIFIIWGTRRWDGEFSWGLGWHEWRGEIKIMRYGTPEEAAQAVAEKKTGSSWDGSKSSDQSASLDQWEPRTDKNGRLLKQPSKEIAEFEAKLDLDTE
jgi:hypothetical protein